MDFQVRFGEGKKKKADTWKRSGGAFKLQILCSDWYLHQMEMIAHFTFQFLGSKFRAFDLRGTKALLSSPCFGFVVYFYLWLYRGSYQVPSINMWAHICDFFLRTLGEKERLCKPLWRKRTLRCIVLETSINYDLIQSQKYVKWIKIWLSKKYNINFLCPCFVLYGLSAVQKASSNSDSLIF